MILALNGNEDTIIEKIVSVLSDEISVEFIQPVKSPVLSFPGLEIKLYQRRVLRDGEDVPLTRLEYGTLAYLASSPDRVFTQEQIFEAVWDMNSDSCHSIVVNIVEIKDQLLGAMECVEDISKKSVGTTGEISVATEEQVTGVDSIVKSMQDIQAGMEKLSGVLHSKEENGKTGNRCQYQS